MQSFGSALASIGWANIVWSMMIAVSMTLAIVHGLVWLRRRDAWANLMFALLAASTGMMSVIELAMMHAPTVEAYGELGRWFHVPVWTAYLSAAGFVRFYLLAGRTWLALTACVLRTVALIINFLAPVNINMRELTGLDYIMFLGTRVATPVGVLNPWMIFAQSTLLLLLVYAVDASVTSWRQNRSRRAVIVGGTLSFFIGLAALQAVMVYATNLRAPFIGSIFFLGIVSVMAYELSRDLLRSLQLAKDLERERTFLDAVFNGIPGMIYMYSPEGKLLRWNKRVEIDSGFTANELMLKNAADWIEPEDLPLLEEAWGKAMKHEQGRIVVNMRMKGDSRGPYLLTGIRADIDGQPHLVGVGIDMSEQTKLELELQESRREMAHMNRVSTMGLLAASIAHELNQPLAAILSNARAGSRLVQRPDLDVREVANIFEDIAREDKRAAEVIHGLRSLMVKKAPTEEDVCINEIVESALALVAGEARSRGVTLEKQVAPDLPPLRGEAVQLKQVLLNLIMNAIEAVGHNGRIVVKSEVVGECVRVSVQDNGPGIPADQLPEIFEPFYTVKERGMGVGLPICRLIVQHHGGSIHVEKAENGGALFYFDLRGGLKTDEGSNKL